MEVAFKEVVNFRQSDPGAQMEALLDKSVGTGADARPVAMIASLAGSSIQLSLLSRVRPRVLRREAAEFPSVPATPLPPQDGPSARSSRLSVPVPWRMNSLS